MTAMHIPVSPALSVYAAAALARIQIRYPGTVFAQTPTAIVVENADAAREPELRSAILHALYQQKIYAETLSMREDLLKTVLG